MSSFIGRSRELDQAAAALGEARLVTLTGAGRGGQDPAGVQVAAEVLAAVR